MTNCCFELLSLQALIFISCSYGLKYLQPPPSTKLGGFHLTLYFCEKYKATFAKAFSETMGKIDLQEQLLSFIHPLFLLTIIFVAVIKTR